MKKIALVAALPVALALAACDGPQEELGEERDDVTEAQAEVMDEKSEALDAEADLMADEGDTGAAAELEAEAEALEDTADGI